MTARIELSTRSGRSLVVSCKTRQYSFKMSHVVARRKWCFFLQNLERCALLEGPGNYHVGIEDRLDRHFARRLTLAIADFKSAFLTPAFLACARAWCRSSWRS